MGQRARDHAHHRAAVVNAYGDPDGTEYAALAMMPKLDAVLSLAEYLDVPVAEAGGMLMKGTAAPAIQRRNAQRAEEQRAAGYVPCRKCSGQVMPSQMCACGEVAPGSMRTLTGLEADAILRRRFVDPSMLATP
jgi:hypothetical protein